MDITIQMRSLDLLRKMIKRDMTGVPQYGYVRQKQFPKYSAISAPLPRCTPEEAGISCAVVERLYKELDALQDELGLHGVLLMRHGKVFAEGYWAPYRAKLPHMLYSASKSIVSTAIGMAWDEGLINLDEELESIFPQNEPLSNKWSKMLTVRHLLTMSTGSRFNEVGSALDADWVRMFMESVPKFEPGTQFDYNSMNTYMLSAVLKQKTGCTVVDYLTPRLFEPLGITNFQWEKCPMGIEKGGWGLYLCLEDLAKIAKLYLQKGVWEGHRLLSEEWINEATREQIPTPNGELKQGYGYQIWINQNGVYQFNGAFGQYAVMMPKYDAAAIVFSGCNKLFAKSGLMQLIENCFWGSGEELPPYPAGKERLDELLSSLRLEPPHSRRQLGCDMGEYENISRFLDLKEYRLGDNYGSIFPQPLQYVHGCFSQGVHMVRFAKTPNGLAVTFYEQQERNTLFVSADGGFTDCLVTIKDETHLVSTRGIWHTEETGIYLTLFVSYVETPDTRVIELRILGDNIEIVFDESPSAEGAALMLLELVGLMDESMTKRLAPAMKHVPGFNEDTLKEMVKKFSAPRAYGSMIRCHDILQNQLPEEC